MHIDRCVCEHRWRGGISVGAAPTSPPRGARPNALQRKNSTHAGIAGSPPHRPGRLPVFACRAYQAEEAATSRGAALNCFVLCAKSITACYTQSATRVLYLCILVKGNPIHDNPFETILVDHRRFIIIKQTRPNFAIIFGPSLTCPYAFCFQNVNLGTSPFQ